MVVPTQAELRLPILEILAEQNSPITIRQIKEVVRECFSDSEPFERIRSGALRIDKHTEYVVFGLRKDGLINNPRYGQQEISEIGREFLIENARKPDGLRTGEADDISTEETIVSGQSLPEDRESAEYAPIPDVLMETAYQQLRSKLADDMLDALRHVDYYHFEHIVVDLLETMGYGKGQVTSPTHDGGIDGIIDQDPLGLEKVYIQAKRWQNQVGVPPINEFSESLVNHEASKGVFITTSTFSSTARQTANRLSSGDQFIRLIDGEELVSLMIDHNVGVVPETTYVIKNLDENFFAEN